MTPCANVTQGSFPRIDPTPGLNARSRVGTACTAKLASWDGDGHPPDAIP